MDALLGYPTEFQPGRIRIAFDERQMRLDGRAVSNARRQGFESERAGRSRPARGRPAGRRRRRRRLPLRFGGHANPHRTVQGYAWAMQDHGGRLLQHTEVAGFTVRNNQVRAVQTSRGAFSCDHLVLAAGPGTAKLARMLDVHIPMVRPPGPRWS